MKSLEVQTQRGHPLFPVTLSGCCRKGEDGRQLGEQLEPWGPAPTVPQLPGPRPSGQKEKTRDTQMPSDHWPTEPRAPISLSGILHGRCCWGRRLLLRAPSSQQGPLASPRDEIRHFCLSPRTWLLPSALGHVRVGSRDQLGVFSEVLGSMPAATWS